MTSKNKLSWLLYSLGLFVVVGTHLYMLLVGVPADQMTAHAILNLVAALLMASGWLTS